MLNRLTGAGIAATPEQGSALPSWAVPARDTINGFLSMLRHAVTTLGVLAIAVLALMFVRPDLADKLKALSPFASADSDSRQDQASDAVAANAAPAQAAATGPLLGSTVPMQAALRSAAESPADASQQQRVANWLSKRYRVASDATSMLVSAAYRTAKEIKLDPLLILSVMAIESGFNPFAESPVGAKGLMQVMAKLHHDKFQPLGGVKAALNPLANIRVGSLILKDYVTRGGSIEAGLKLYVGAGNLDTDFGYGARVLAEYHRLKEVAVGKKVPVYASADPAPAKPAAPAKVDPGTTTTATTSTSQDGKEEQLATL